MSGGVNKGSIYKVHIGRELQSCEIWEINMDCGHH